MNNNEEDFEEFTKFEESKTPVKQESMNAEKLIEALDINKNATEPTK